MKVVKDPKFESYIDVVCLYLIIEVIALVAIAANSGGITWTDIIIMLFAAIPAYIILAVGIIKKNKLKKATVLDGTIIGGYTKIYRDQDGRYCSREVEVKYRDPILYKDVQKSVNVGCFRLLNIERVIPNSPCKVCIYKNKIYVKDICIK